jgi:hypothetical protein
LTGWQTYGNDGAFGYGRSVATELMEPMAPRNYLLLAVYKGDNYIHLVRPVADGDLLAIGGESDELENVIVLKVRSSGHAAQLAEPLNQGWPDRTPVGVVTPGNGNGLR